MVRTRGQNYSDEAETPNVESQVISDVEATTSREPERLRAASPARSVASDRSTVSTSARSQQAHLEWEEEIALIRKKELEIEEIKRKLALDLMSKQKSENITERRADNTDKVEDWIRSTVAVTAQLEPEKRVIPERMTARTHKRGELSHGEASNGRARSPTPQQSTSRSREVDQLVEALDKLSKNRAPPRQTYELPIFSGSTTEWFVFKAAMRDTTKMFKFTATENMARLRNCLRGEAREAVATILHTVDDPNIILETLEQCFGTPETIVEKTLSELRRLPRPGPSPKEQNMFAVRIQNTVSVLRAIDNKGYLYNPMLTQNVLEKLSLCERKRWYDYAKEHRDKKEPEIMLLSKFLMAEAKIALEYGCLVGETASTAKKDSNKVGPKINQNKNKVVYVTTESEAEAERINKCIKCKSNHLLPKCPLFLKMNPDERWDFVKKEKLCFKCISSRHRRINCRAKICGENECRRPHHILLHTEPTTPASLTDSSSSDAIEKVNTMITTGREVKLKICPVTVSGPKGHVKIFALLDEGSTVSLLDEEVAKDIGAEGPSKLLSIRGVSMCQQDMDSKMVKFKIAGTNGQEFTMRARTMKNMNLSPQTICQRLLRLEHLKDLNQKGVCYEQGKPRLLVGADNWEMIVSRELRLGKRNQPAASRTQLGWVIHGTVPRTMLREGTDSVLHIVSGTNDRLEELVEEHFKIDALGVALNPKVNKSDERAIEIFQKTSKRVDGHFEVGLPWREDDPKMPPSYNSALRRLKNLEQKLDKSPDMKIEYEKQIQNLLNKCYAEECVNGEKQSPRAWFLPHFPVTNPNKPGKVRLVFDAAAKSSGVCLNDFLLEGPDLLQSLQTILFRFRERKIAVTADIQEMFLRIKIRKEDQPAQLFLWRGNNRELPPKEYKMTSMIFGASSSPFLAHSVRNKNAQEFSGEHPEAVKAITEAHYMDDYVDSYDNKEKAIEITSKVDQIHQKCGFTLRGWNSNSEDVLNTIPEELRARTKTQLLSGCDASEKTLGLQWNAAKDTLGFNTSLSRVSQEVKNLSRPPTKREALSTVMSLYDPLGLLSCYSITAKILLQKMWREKISWDEVLPEEFAQEFTSWLGKMNIISELELPRCYDTEEKTVKGQLHVFCDASENAFATAAYWRLEKEDGTAKLVLVAAKAKVAPLRVQTIPRLELQAAVIGTRLAATIQKEHRWTTDEVTYWTDSRTVLHWIQNDSVRYTPFVAHRLGEITETTRPNQWRWIPTELNVADLATRPNYTPASNGDRWFQGPAFLWERKSSWPQFMNRENDDDDTKESVLHTEVVEDSLPDINRFSNYERLIRATAAILVFIDKCRKQTKTTEVRHIIEAERLWMMKSQRDSFSEELEILRKGKTIPQRSRIYKLDPIKGDDGLLRVNGRINAANVSLEMKQPVILDGRHPFTKLLVQKEHRASGHANQERVVNDLRQRYWVIRMRPTVRAIARDCGLCRIRKVLPKTPVTGDLPSARVTPYHRPFSNCGVDYFGPLVVTIGRRHEKRWGALFTCLTTRAVHLEMVNSLSTDSAIMALRRMAARRGWPAVIFSDNATNFRGADVELRAAYKEWAPALQHYGLLHRVTWRFIPPGAPHQGGVWERLVRSVKVALTAALQQKTPKEEVLQTLLVEAEYSINARPLTHVPVNPSDPEAITPNHFLLGSSAGLPVTGPCQLADRRTWRASQALADEFWRRWVREYLPTLVPRRGAATNERTLQQGDLVVVVDPSLPRNTWPRGVVERVYPGPDGGVRSADVRTRGGIFRRPTTKLAVLPVEGYAESSPGGEC